jgi:hypothetical protein
MLPQYATKASGWQQRLEFWHFLADRAQMLQLLTALHPLGERSRCFERFH